MRGGEGEGRMRGGKSEGEGWKSEGWGWTMGRVSFGILSLYTTHQ